MAELTASTAAGVRAALTRARITQQQAGIHLGLSQQAISDRLRGRTPFSLSDLERLADLLGVEVSEFISPRRAA